MKKKKKKYIKAIIYIFLFNLLIINISEFAKNNYRESTITSSKELINKSYLSQFKVDIVDIENNEDTYGTSTIDKENIIDKDIDFPVHIIQKTGPDNEKNVLLFMGDGYTIDEQDKFIIDITERIKKIFEIEPFKSFSNEFNIYVMQVASNESGIGRQESNSTEAIEKDSYFKIKFNSYGIDRLADFSIDGKVKANKLKEQFQNNYLDKGAKIFHTNILLNSTYYGGSGGEISIGSLSTGEKMLVHEAAHSFAGLRDEYFTSGVGEGPNRTFESNPNLIKWKEFLGFRGIDIVKYGTDNNRDIFKPTENCLMNSLDVSGFCEVCKLQIETTFNRDIKNKRKIYIANPITTIATTGLDYQSGKEIKDSNIMDALGERIELRTVVKNFTTEDKLIELKFTITDKNGQVKNDLSEIFIIQGGELKSLKILTDKLDSINEGDKITGKVIEKIKTEKFRMIKPVTENLEL